MDDNSANSGNHLNGDYRFCRIDGSVHHTETTLKGVPWETATLNHLVSPTDPRARERTVTENVSPHGTCIISERSWKPGEEVIVAPRGEFQQKGRVVYCVGNTRGRFCLGVEFPDRSVKWGDDSV
ncbi:MAG: hypothetical protein DMG46_01445 [Acidobacteria bacterium]|nr:MAG: hypothetical protein DMG46_01445 [Acidobacteriota bacterium]